MERVLAAAGRSARRIHDRHGSPWHVTRSGNVRPVRFDVRAKLVHLNGNERPYFSITGEIRRTVGGGDRCITGGCIHDEILHVWPDLAPLVRVHLSDDRGVPMHAAANAAFWAGETKYQVRDVALLADHLRVDQTTAATMADVSASIDGEHRAAVWSSVVFDRFGMAARWSADAAAARAMLREIPAVTA